MQSRHLAVWSRVGVATLLAQIAAGCSGEIPSAEEGGAAGGGSVGGTAAGVSPSGARDAGTHLEGGTGGANRPSPAAGAAAGVGGSVSGGSGSVAPVSAPEFACDKSMTEPVSNQAPVAALRRLTMRELGNSVLDLVRFVGGTDISLQDQIRTSIEKLPLDRREPVPQDPRGSYRRLDQTLQQVHVEALYALSRTVAAALTDESHLASTVGACATDSDSNNDAACLSQFIARFGGRALRRPLAQDEIEFYRLAYGEDPHADRAAYADLIGLFLNSPEFVYFVEHGAEPLANQPGTFSLSAYELASRLSYQLWQTAPDAALLAAAKDGSLLENSGFSAQLDRLLRDPRARATLQEFFEDWVKAEDLPALDAKRDDPIFQAFAGEDLPEPSLRRALIDDATGLLGYFTWDEPASVGTWFLTQKSFARDARLARIYGAPIWDERAVAARMPPSMPDDARPGLLTRALFLTTGSANTRPIMKGVFIRRQILCDDIPPPPPGANSTLPELRPDMTTREVVEELTEASGSTCAACHATLINALGFATENFDALGRLRVEQSLFDEHGRIVGTKPVDTSGVPRVRLQDSSRLAGAEELMRKVVESGKVEACLARNYFRFTFARWEDLRADGCVLEDMRRGIASGQSFQELMRRALASEAFHSRRFE
ncbi:MAG TPA: DUF1592 domain-containing protein [Polyangiaceae bacterium]|nr:DUF1592 domain-containing protein [Polyangiaceae bacterium]